MQLELEQFVRVEGRNMNMEAPIVMTHLYFNIVLAIFVPLGIISHFLNWGDIPTFVLNFFAIVPLAKMLDFTTDQISMRLGQTLGALMNASFGNAIELIVAIIALKEHLILVVQTSLLGSILSNLLFVLGWCFFLGGIKFPTQTFNKHAVNLTGSLLILTLLAYVLPAAFGSQINNTLKDDGSSSDRRVLDVSRGAAIVLAITYGAFLLFQLKTHAHLYVDPNEKSGVSDPPSPHPSRPSSPRTSMNGNADNKPPEVEDDEEEEPTVTPLMATVALLVTTVIIAVCAEFLVSSIEGLSTKSGLSESFIGFIILPLVGNAAEHVTAVSAAMRNKMDLAIGVALGSSIQIAIFVTPVLVLLGWIIGVPLSLDFATFETAVLVLTVLIVNALVWDGETNWIEGYLLLASYVVIAISFYYLRPSDQTGQE
ncbi:hypothetical protein HDV00_008724 [Rhizophlyctis rosea]|nr:hypothetical protein HDV00_008724 [Rhizophlyctis rosea]